ncbi:helix-turn-helix domain-containing protein [Sodalis endosymbiont of Spalangia cameroni]|uniref:helix-turn-helix domain-containing protein n=1 Tax=Sodalis praecaptivus TaxID=1239307 RepID=UPI0031F7BAC5
MTAPPSLTAPGFAPEHLAQRASRAVRVDTGQTTPLGLEAHIPGERIAGNEAHLQPDILVQIFRRQRTEQSVQVPAVAEPLLVWILTGCARVEERGVGERWQAKDVSAGDFYLTATDVPYEMRWQAHGPEPFEVMHVYLGVSLLEEAVAQVQGRPCRIREAAGERDEVISQLLALCRRELLRRHDTSTTFIAGLAQCLAVHLARFYVKAGAGTGMRRPALQAFLLQKATAEMDARLSQPFDLAVIAQAAGLSKYHFSRQFKNATGLSPSNYFIRLRMRRARQLLADTRRSIIDIGLEVGYSSPGHFSQVFRREVGVSPSHYRQ